MIVALFLHPDRPQALQLARVLVDWLAAQHHQVRLPVEDAARMGRHELGAHEDEIAAGIDLALCIGGDGTMLRTVDVVAAAGAPVLGINVGQLGYLTEVEPADAVDAVARFLRGEHRIEERMLLQVTLPATGHQALAFNEVVVEKAPGGQPVRLEAIIDGSSFTTYLADGLIVASPTGSTAYSFSVRGPVVDPAHRAMVMTPVSPHQLFDRSLVLGPNAMVGIVLRSTIGAVVTIDGRYLTTLHDGDEVHCTAAPVAARLVRFGPHEFHRVLKAKFGLSDR